MKTIKIVLATVLLLVITSGITYGQQMPPFASSLQNDFIEVLIAEQIPVSIFLVNGIKLQGQIQGLAF